MTENQLLSNDRGRLMELVADAGVDCKMVFDKELYAVYCSESSEILTGYRREEAVGKHFFELFPDSSGNTEVKNALSQALRGEKSFVSAEKVSYRKGCHEQHYIPLKDGEQILGLLNVVYDVAHRLKVEQELKSLNRSLARKNKELKTRNAELLSYADITSRYLNDPLQKVYNLAEVIVDKESDHLSDDGKANIKKIQAAVQRMRLLTDDISTYSQLNREKTVITDVNMNHILLLAISNMQEEIKRRNAIVESGVLPVVRGYKSMLLTLFENILGNAFKFQHQDNKPLVKVSADFMKGDVLDHSDAFCEVQYVQIRFTDNGIGFDPKKSEQVFQMFYRANPQSYEGYGIGLSVCKKIAEIHNGFISAETEIGKGCTINVYLPAAKNRYSA